jgi:hypothetical protein
MPEVEDSEKQTYTLELGKYEFCIVVRLILLELKSDRPGPMARHHMPLLVEKMKNAEHDTGCVEENWEEVFGGEMTAPDEVL